MYDKETYIGEMQLGDSGGSSWNGPGDCFGRQAVTWRESRGITHCPAAQGNDITTLCDVSSRYSPEEGALAVAAS